MSETPDPSHRRLQRDGFCLLPDAVDSDWIRRLQDVCSQTFAGDTTSVRARSSRGHVYAARNLIATIPEVSTVWRCLPLVSFLRGELGAKLGLVRALFFDKPPERTWHLPWHKDTAIAVRDNQLASQHFSRPTVKAGVPHLIASDEVLRRMLTLRIHLDDANDENGPLRVIPGSHVSSESEGVGVAGEVIIHARAGDVLAMRPLISHASGSSVEGTQRHRRILHLEFAASESLPDGVRWHDFVGV
ncbi:phytanoyl-CoA dioxygenase family protein [Roseimaritima sediminicola]|uniref:phytanoyl-CoA dioxygenase family protein n=1 Tax=Roseimaritima sediminicola TaxID=2662066 RepID=UPI0012985219|nr:phytanoyl-CoA dioxygenase family protein [Roseimaritima sediminicola]